MLGKAKRTVTSATRFTALLLAFAAAGSLPSAAQMLPGQTLQSCASLASEALRRQCTESLIGRSGAAPALQPLGGGWRLSRGLEPQSGVAAVSIQRTAEPSSDPGFAGLVFRCGPTRIEALLAVLDPLPPTATATVTLTVAGETLSAPAESTQGGTLVRLADSAAQLLARQKNDASASFEIKARETLRGSVALAGLAGALEVLKANCPGR